MIQIPILYGFLRFHYFKLVLISISIWQLWNTQSLMVTNHENKFILFTTYFHVQTKTEFGISRNFLTNFISLAPSFVIHVSYDKFVLFTAYFHEKNDKRITNWPIRKSFTAHRLSCSWHQTTNPESANPALFFMKFAVCFDPDFCLRAKMDQNANIKYYSPTVADGKTFVLVFCVL